MDGFGLVGLFGEIHCWSTVGTAATVVLAHVVVADAGDVGVACWATSAVCEREDYFVAW